MERPNTIPWPPLFFGGGILIGFLLGYLVPLPWFTGTFEEVLFMMGILLVLGGLAIDLKAISTLRKRDTTVMPHKASTHLVIEGPYGFSRNPIYLGNTILMFGMGLVFGNLWLFVTGLGVAFLTNQFAILREEAHLKMKFGNSWQKYANRVRRWI